MHEISIAAEAVFSIFGFPVTNTLLMGWFVLLALGGAAFFFLRRPKLIPSGVQNIFEFTVEAVLGLLESSFGSREKAERYFPFIATIFLFILVSNWFGIFPFLGAISVFHFVDGHEASIPLFRSSASDINFTLALAVLSVFATQFFGIAAIGFFKYAGRFISFRNPVAFFVGALEIVSEIAKIISFSFRLFGNIFAGEILLLIIGFLAPYGAPVPFLMLEIFVGLVQALVFAMLTTVFVSIAVAEHQ
ncbi:MAG: F0F1 ATP synthase subunit A [Parcubacteria group bacterium]|nr:F0F1 ATP synthase subunit A [Parcubacteria group bacterium]MBI2175231.1 F0F1 ATP synthase subunit A [Parcubacteria group bacterium]